MSDPPDDERRQPEVSGNYPAISNTAGLQTSDEDVFVVVTQAFDGHGHSLIRPDGPSFDGFPGVSLWIELPDGRSGEVTLSPIHGDPRKVGFTDVPDGTRCRLSGVRGGPPLDVEGPCACGQGTYHRLYLSPRLLRGETVLLCDIWGCHRSRIVDDSDLLSWVDY
jgi:hypothetical protein